MFELPFSIGVMVGNNNYKSALGFNALFFYGRALTVHERTLMMQGVYLSSH
jgi:hypothetical protein